MKDMLKANIKFIAFIVLCAALAGGIIWSTIDTISYRQESYESAVRCMEHGNYYRAAVLFDQLAEYSWKDSKHRLDECIEELGKIQMKYYNQNGGVPW